MKKSFFLFLVVVLTCIHANSSPVITNPFYYYSPTAGEQIRSNLYALMTNASTILLDGDLTQYDPSYSDSIDGLDARKMSNFSENLGMIRATTTLVVERRHTIGIADTIFYKLWNVQQRPYQLEFITNNLNHPGLMGYLEDSYLHTSVPINLNGSNNINFSVNANPASSAMYRFRIIFTTRAFAPLPLTFTMVKAYQQNNVIKVDWTTQTEQNMKQYNVEKSTDGARFSSGQDIAAGNLSVNNYTWTDAYPADGYNYYRIRSTDRNGTIKYSAVAKVSASKGIQSIKVFPNPVTDNTIHLQLANQPEGFYVIKLVNNSGQAVMTTQIQHAGGTGTEAIRPAQHVPKGIYQLEVTKPDGSKLTMPLMY